MNEWKLSKKLKKTPEKKVVNKIVKEDIDDIGDNFKDIIDYTQDKDECVLLLWFILSI